MQIRKAERKQAKIKMGLQGPSGSGKTYGALLIAYGLVGDWNKIVVIDSEHHSADLYAHLGNFNVINLNMPFSPEHYVQAIETCEEAGMKAVIIDSISQEWDGAGGILDVHGAMTGNSFTNWNKITPRHNFFVQKILLSPVHIIATIRSKQDYVLTEKNGKMVPEKVGLKGVTREGLDYEFTLVLEIDIKHNTTATKDRTGLFMDKPQFTITAGTGEKILSWCLSGVTAEDVLNEVQSTTTIDELRLLYTKYPGLSKQLENDFLKRKSELAEADNIIHKPVNL